MRAMLAPGNARPLYAALLLAVALMSAGCLRSPEEKRARFLESGKKHLEAKDYTRAALDFSNATQADPKNAEAHYQLALAYLGAGDGQSAYRALQKATQLDPKHKDAQVRLAELLATSREEEVLEDAAKRVREVLANAPSDPDALNVLALTEWRLGKREEAEEHLKEAFEKSPQNLKSSFSLVALKIAQRDIAGAEAVLKKVVASTPGNAAPVVAMGAFYVATGKTADAEQQYRRALEIDPKHGLALMSLAGTKWRAGQKDEAERLYAQASASGDPRYKPAHAIFLFQSGDRDRGIAEFEKLSEADPSDRAARTRLVTAYFLSKRLPDAEKVLAAAIEKNPKDADALLQRSQMRLRAGKHAEAQADLSNVLRFDPNSGRVHYLLSKVYQAQRSVLRQRQELSEAVRLDPNLLVARLELAQLLTATNAANSALTLLSETPQAQKNTLPVLIQQNWAHLVLGKQAEAANGIQRGMQRAKAPELFVQEAILKSLQRDYPGARRAAEEALRANPEDVNALNVLVQTYTAQKQGAAGLERVRQHAAQRPSSAMLQQYLGEQLARAGQREEARKAFSAAKAANTELTAADLALAQLDVAEGKLDDARGRLSALAASNPSDVRIHLLSGDLEGRASKYADSVAHYRKAVGLDDRNIFALNNLAFILAEYGRQPDEALKYAEMAHELAPDSPNVQDTLGWVYYRKGLYSMAVKYLEAAVSKEPTGIRQSHLAIAYIKSGDRKRGLELIQTALKLDPKLAESPLFQEVWTETR